MERLIIYILNAPWQATSVVIFVLFPLAFAALYTAVIWAMKLQVEGTIQLRTCMLRFAYSLVPIMMAYHFAHYFSFMLSSLGFVLGADYVWYVQLIVIVLGHAFAAYIAHQIALIEFWNRKQAILSQLPMLVLMVFYTGFGLWILAQPFAPGAS